MGGDGGTIGASRLYMRGVGSADHTADAARPKKNKEDRNEAMTNCALTGAPLDFINGSIVACGLGRLYNREAALEALLNKKSLGSHVRGLKDLHEAKFHLVKGKPTCPITGVELNGKQSAILIIQKPNARPHNVLSERCLKEVGMNDLQAEYGPFTKNDILKLAPPASELEDIQEQLLRKQQSKKKKHKSSESKQIVPKKAKSEKSAVDIVKATTASEVASSAAFSSLFTSASTDKTQSERNNDLFAR